MPSATPVTSDRSGDPVSPSLRERETRAQLAIEVAELGTWSWDLRTGDGDIDDRGARIVGLVPGDVGDVRQAQLDRVHPDDLARLDQTIRDGIAAGGVFTIEYRVLHPDGTIHHVSSRARVMAADDGVPIKLIGTNRDVTREREIEIALREGEERYRTLFESIDEGFCLVEVQSDDDHRAVDYLFLEVNPAFARQTGLEDAVGRTARELVPDLEPVWAETLGRVASTREPLRWMDESHALGRWFDLFAFPVGVPEQRRVAVVFTNVTDRVRAEEERDAILERERQARAAAEAFLAVMSHELRTPITSIYGTATILAKDPRRPDVAELVADMQDEAERLRRITDDLMVLSGVERGVLQLSPEPVVLQHAIADTVSDVRRRFPGVDIVMELPPSPPPVIADTTALRQVLYNLLTNAAKYAGRDGPITIAVTAGDRSALVEILDEGPGPGDDPAALFGLFYRSPHTAKRASGTGIGLYVASALLQAMGSTIQAAHRDARGAIFRFRLPYARDDAG
jgi:PAS domain S-box-containing protein